MSWSETYNNGSIVASGGGVGLSGLWSDPATWGGSLPTSTDAVVISSGQTVYLDTASAVALSVDVQGTLRSLLTPTANIALTTGNINVGSAGVLQIGTEASPFPSSFTCTLTLNGAEVGRTARTVAGTSLGFTNNGVGRSIQVQPGGTLTLIGVAPTFKRTKLNAHATAGNTSFTLADTTGWLAGDDIAIGTTDFYGVAAAEKLTLSANASGTGISTTAGIAANRWGLLQYAVDAGISLTNTGLTGSPAAIGTASATPVTIDERAMVINLRRNIIVQGANDTAWTSNKFGVHMMFMSSGTTTSNLVQPNVKLDGVRMIRCGQAGALGRYPIHWHMCSYRMDGVFTAPSATGTFIGALTNNYAKNCAIEQSGQRMITIHGTHGLTLDANVGFDITGHAIFLEDGAEQNNVISNNVVMKVRAPTSGNKLLNHDVGSGSPNTMGVTSTVGSACYWNTNPKNTWSNNWANDSEGAGFWSSFATQCFGLSVNVALAPVNIPLTLIDGTVSMGNNGAGQLTNDTVLNDKGDLIQNAYAATFLSLPIRNLQLYKNAAGGYSNRIQEGTYQNFICADNAGMDVFGQSISDLSVMVNALAVAESLNNSTSRRLSSYRAAFATYHELLNFKNCTCVGYTYIAGIQDFAQNPFVGGGLFRLWDLYLQGIFSFSENTGLKLVNCDVPFRSLPPFLDGAADGNRHWAIAGAIYDKNGIFGNTGKYWVYDVPFLTYNATSPTNITSGIPANGKVTTDHYFAVGDFKCRGDLGIGGFQLPINITREDPTATGATGTTVGTWNVPDGATSWAFPNMRHFTAANGGRYKISIPNSDSGTAHPPDNYFEFGTKLMKSAGDRFLIAVPFTNTVTARVYQGTRGIGRNADNTGNVDATSSAIASGYARFLTSTGSLANVIADTTGTIFFQDTTNQLVWLQVAVQTLTSTAIAGGNYGTDKFEIEYVNTLTIVTV